jgi:hypothetical protein
VPSQSQQQQLEQYAYLMGSAEHVVDLPMYAGVLQVILFCWQQRYMYRLSVQLQALQYSLRIHRQYKLQQLLLLRCLRSLVVVFPVAIPACVEPVVIVISLRNNPLQPQHKHNTKSCTLVWQGTGCAKPPSVDSKPAAH